MAETLRQILDLPVTKAIVWNGVADDRNTWWRRALCTLHITDTDSLVAPYRKAARLYMAAGRWANAAECFVNMYKLAPSPRVAAAALLCGALYSDALDADLEQAVAELYNRAEVDGVVMLALFTLNPPLLRRTEVTTAMFHYVHACALLRGLAFPYVSYGDLLVKQLAGEPYPDTDAVRALASSTVRNAF